MRQVGHISSDETTSDVRTTCQEELDRGRHQLHTPPLARSQGRGDDHPLESLHTRPHGGHQRTKRGAEELEIQRSTRAKTAQKPDTMKPTATLRSENIERAYPTTHAPPTRRIWSEKGKTSPSRDPFPDWRHHNRREDRPQASPQTTMDHQI
ncbi:hypothetical protein YC2023_066490 [Brassica napus]